jgi:hypothetical protein
MALLIINLDKVIGNAQAPLRTAFNRRWPDGAGTTSMMPATPSD